MHAPAPVPTPIPALARVVVLMGGDSAERPVSLASGTQVAHALERAGYSVTALDVRDAELPELLTHHPALRDADCVFPVLHGGAGEDGTVQAILELLGIPFVGSDRLGCALSMDKEVAKHLFRDVGIATADWLVGVADEAGVMPASVFDAVEARLGYPVIVKPPSGGSTLGLTLAKDRAALEAGARLSASHERRVLFEAYIRGRELTVGVVGGEPLPVGEIRPANELFDYECKYAPGMAEELFPAPIADEHAREAQARALRVFEVLRLRDVGRVDFILDDAGELWCLEANALPGMTETSLLPGAARAAGWSFEALCARIVQGALARVRGGQPGAHPAPTGTPSEPSG
jgi:D-alanine-D-alanine ligase